MIQEFTSTIQCAKTASKKSEILIVLDEIYERLDNAGNIIAVATAAEILETLIKNLKED